MMARGKQNHRASVQPPPRPIGQQSSEVVHQQMMMQAQFHQGPLPPPELLRQYDQLSPGAADRIIAMAEGEAAHRREMERQQLESDIAHRQTLTRIEGDRLSGIFASDKTGQLLGAAVSAIALLAAATTAYVGVAYGVTSRWYWLIPVALVSLPVLGMVQAVRNRVGPTPGERAAGRPPKPQE